MVEEWAHESFPTLKEASDRGIELYRNGNGPCILVLEKDCVEDLRNYLNNKLG